MPDDKQIRISVDASAYEQYESKMRQSAENLARGMISSSRAYTTSAKEVLSSIEEQIKAIEKRNALDKEFRTREAQSLRESGKISDVAYRREIGAIGTETKEDKLQTQLLREVIETIKTTSRQEIRENRTDVEKQIQASKTVGKLGPQGDEFSILKESIQQEELNRLRRTEVYQRGDDLRSLTNISTEVAGANNAVGLIGGGMQTGGTLLKGLKGGLLVGAITMIAGKLFEKFGESASNLEGSLGEYSKYTGVDVANMGEAVSRLYKKNTLSNMGYTPSDYYARMAQMYQSGKTMNLGESGLNLMSLGDVRDVDLGSMLSLRRFGGGSVSGTTMYFEKYLQKTGQDIGALSETVQQFVHMANNVVSQTGRVDTNYIAATMGEFGARTGFRGEVLGSTFGAVEKGLQRSSNPVIQAIQFRAARSAGAKSLWQAEKMMGSPFAPENAKYVEEMLGYIKTIDDEEMRQRAISNIFGINPNLSGGVSQWVSAAGNKSLTSQELQKWLKVSSVDYTGKRDAQIGETAESTAKFEGFRENQFGKIEAAVGAMNESMEWINKSFEDVVEANKNTLKTMQDVKQNTQDIADELKKQGHWFLGSMVQKEANQVGWGRTIR